MSDNVELPVGPGTETEAEQPEMVINLEQICTGCRCGWLACDCYSNCFACKDRIRQCYCSKCIYPGMRCEICVYYLPFCVCREDPRCKWCRISLDMCKRGGCIQYLPSRWSPEAEPLIPILRDEDGPDDDDINSVGDQSVTSFALPIPGGGANLSRSPSGSSSEESGCFGSTAPSSPPETETIALSGDEVERGKDENTSDISSVYSTSSEPSSFEG